jgi:hypothetical protein
MDKRLRFMTDLIEPLMVPPGSTVKLSRDHDPGYTGQVPRQQAADLLADGVNLLAGYQDRLAAQDTYGVLLVLQGLDASGKDSTIKHVMRAGPRLPPVLPARPARAGQGRHLQPLPLRGGARRPGTSNAAGRGTDARPRETCLEPSSC